MIEALRPWLDLVNAQSTWTDDDAMLRLVPEEEREFESSERWPRLKALAFLNNNVNALRLNHERLEAGEALDPGLLNPVLDGVRLQISDWRRHPRAAATLREHLERGTAPSSLVVARTREGWNRGTSHLRWIVHRAFFGFARYADLRLADPAWPGATAGILRVLGCPSCGALVACPTGQPRWCSEACATDTGRLD